MIDLNEFKYRLWCNLIDRNIDPRLLRNIDIANSPEDFRPLLRVEYQVSDDRQIGMSFYIDDLSITNESTAERAAYAIQTVLFPNKSDWMIAAEEMMNGNTE